MSRLIAFFLSASIVSVAAASANERYPVSPYVNAVKLERTGEVLFRYVEFFETYPCLRLETFEPISRKPVDRKDVCSFRIDDLTIDTRTDVAAVFFEKMRLEGSTFLFSADLSLRRADAHYLNCKLAISNKGKLSEPVCIPGERPPEPDDSK